MSGLPDAETGRQSRTMDVVPWKRNLEQAVELLHADAVAQNAWLAAEFAGERGVVVDELALQFDDLWLGGLIVYADALPADVRLELGALDRALNEMSGIENADLWTPDALLARPEWTHVRALALTALNSLRRSSSEHGK